MPIFTPFSSINNGIKSIIQLEKSFYPFTNSKLFHLISCFCPKTILPCEYVCYKWEFSLHVLFFNFITMKRLLFLSLFVCAITCFAFTNAAAPEVQRTISGTVYDLSSHQPLEGIYIQQINGTSSSSTKTDVSGHFSITVKNSSQTATLKFSDPDYGDYSTRTEDFDLSKDNTNVSVYMQ